MNYNQKQVKQTFYFLYITVMLNTLLESFYTRVMLEVQKGQLDFDLIITILQVIAPVFGGFIVDHVQYTLNLMLMGMMLSVVSYLYFMVIFFKNNIVEYLFFSIGFHVLAIQLQWIIIMTLISKAFTQQQIPKQMASVVQFTYIGKILSFIALLPLAIQNTDNLNTPYLLKSQLFFIYSILMGIALFCCTICVYVAFPIIRTHAYQQNPRLKSITLDNQMGLLLSFKRLLNTSRAVIALAAASIISIIDVWQDYQYTVIGQHFSEVKKSSNVYSLLLSNISFAVPYLVAIIIAPLVGKYLAKTDDRIGILSTSTSLALFCFLMLSQVMLFQESLILLRILIYIVMLTGLQVAYVFAMISSTTIIGYLPQNYQTHGFSFGLLSMFNNVFEVWVLSVLTAEIRQKQIRDIFQIQIVCIFAICFSLVGFIITKVLSFINQQEEQKTMSNGSAENGSIKMQQIFYKM